MALPVTRLGRAEVSRLIIGGNPFSGVSHQSGEHDRAMRDYYTAARIKDTLHACEAAGINTLFARADNHIMRLLNEYWNDGGTILWFAQTAPERGNPTHNIQQAASAGATGIYVHGGVTDAFYEQGKLESVAEQLAAARQTGAVVGMASHHPRVHLGAQELDLDVDFYMQCAYNLTGRRGKIDVADPEERFDPEDPPKAYAAVRALRKPCVVYKVLAAGRRDPETALKEAYRNIKDADAVLIGMFTKHLPTMVEDNVRLVGELLGTEVTGSA